MSDSSNQNAPVQLDVFIPGLFEGLAGWPENYNENQQETALGWFLSHGNYSKQDVVGFEACLWRCFDPGLKPNDELPVAALRTNKIDAPSLCADPVHLKIGVADVELFSGPDLMLSQAESEKLVALINGFIKQDGFEFNLDESGWGTLVMDEKADIKTTALSVVPGQGLTEKLPAGPEQSRWHQLNNEIQMLLHDTDFNQQREAAGKLPINTLWFWGGGELIRPLESDYQLIVSDNHLAKSFAKRTDTKIIPVPESIEKLLEINPEEKVLLVLEELFAYCQKDDYFGWINQLEQYERKWFAPLKKHAEKNVIKTFNIITSTGERFDCSSRHRWRFWRKEHDLQYWVNR